MLFERWRSTKYEDGRAQPLLAPLQTIMGWVTQPGQFLQQGFSNVVISPFCAFPGTNAGSSAQPVASFALVRVLSCGITRLPVFAAPGVPLQVITNKAGLVESVAGDIRPPNQRNTYQQAKAGKTGAPDDEGGHILASILGGPGEAINLIPQNANFNRGEWKAFEATLKQAYDSGADVKVKFALRYGDPSLPHRPTQILAAFEINGVPGKKSFANRPGG